MSKEILALLEGWLAAFTTWSVQKALWLQAGPLFDLTFRSYMDLLCLGLISWVAQNAVWLQPGPLFVLRLEGWM